MPSPDTNNIHSFQYILSDGSIPSYIQIGIFSSSVLSVIFLFLFSILHVLIKLFIFFVFKTSSSQAEDDDGSESIGSSQVIA